MRHAGALAALLGLMLMAGCAPAGAPAPKKPPAVEPKETEQPKVQLPTIKAEQLRVEPSLQVKVNRETNLYTGPGQFYLVVRSMPAGSAVTYLGNREGWLRVRTGEGLEGWIPGADADLSDGRGQAVTYRMPAGKWGLTGPDGLAVELTRFTAGAIRLTATGLGRNARADLVQLPGQGALAALVEMPGAIQAATDVGEAGVGRVSISPRGLLIDLEGTPVHKVIENEPGRLILEFRPGLLALEKMEQGWRMIYTGDLRPTLRQEGSEVVVDLSAALAASSFAGAPAGVTMTEVGPEESPVPPPLNSPTAQPPTRMAAGGLRLRFPAPGTPYGLYRPTPGVLELRYLPSGLKGKRIVLDPGHGGEETGAVGPAGVIEKNVNLAIALKLRPLLEQAGAQVIMTRTVDQRLLTPEQAARATSGPERTQMDLADRVAMGKAAGADLFVSVHNNGGGPAERGTEVYWAVPNLNASLSRRLATLAQTELLRALGLADRGVKQRPFNVIRLSDAPATLVEVGFMTNASEEKLLVSPAGQDKAARALFRALERYFTESW